MLTQTSVAIWMDQSQRCRRPQAACQEPAGSYDKTTRAAICFEHKTQYLLNRAPYTRIVVFWHIHNTWLCSLLLLTWRKRLTVSPERSCGGLWERWGSGLKTLAEDMSYECPHCRGEPGVRPIDGRPFKEVEVDDCARSGWSFLLPEWHAQCWWWLYGCCHC